MRNICKGIVYSLFLLISTVSWGQRNTTVLGRVIDDKGNGIHNATIVVKGTRIGASTNENGEFTISVPSTASTLIFSSVGFSTVQIPLDGRSTIEVRLEGSGKYLQSVVVTALGIKREEKALGYSVQKVSGESLQKVSGVDVATSLTGKVAGLLVKNSPNFGVAPELTIRGESPLLVVDGIAYANKTLSDISSEDIESISVLKGATASALYGFRGASGAILVTTRNGSTSKAGLTVNYTSNTMFTAGFLAIPKVQSVYGRGSNGTYDKNSTSSWGTVMDGRTENQWDPKLMAYRDYAYLPIGKNNFKNFLEQGYITNNNLNVEYRKDNVSLRSSVNWLQNKGEYPNSTLNKFTYTFGGDVNLGRFKLSSDLSYARKASPNIGSNAYTAYGPMYSLLIWSPTDFNILDYKNNYWLKKGEVQNYTFQAGSNNPYFDRYEKTNEISRDIFNADVSMSYQIFGGLKASIRSGLDFYQETGQLRTSMGSYLYTGSTGVPGNPYTWNGYLTGGYNLGQNSGFSMNSDLLLTGERSFNKFTVEYLAGGTIYHKRDDNINANTVGGISVPGFFSLNASVLPAYVTQSTAAEQVNSIYGRLGISWNKLIYVEATGRNDWSSTLPSSGRSYFYPSVASSFVISELLPGTRDWLDLLRIRNSWTVSKTPPGIYAINSSYSINSGTWGTLNGASAPGNLYPSGILPASATTLETGLQGVLFKNRLMVDVSYYDKKMQDAIIVGPLSAATGYTGNYINTNEVISRRGWEVMLNGSPVKSRDWQWNIGINWSTYKRIYDKLDSTYSTKAPWVKVGERVDALASKAFLRDPAGNLIFNNGRLQYSQYNSNFGWTDPDWIWGITSTLRYKNISLFLSFDGVSGGIMNTRTESYMWQAGVHPGSVTAARAKDVAVPGSKNFLGQGVKTISGTVTYDAVGNITSDTRKFAANDVYTTYQQYVIDLHNSSAWGGNGSSADTYSKTFFKLREVSLTYDLPAKYLNKVVKAASISFVGQNVFLKAKDFKYSDPDGGAEDFAAPAVRYLGGNIKFTF
ncbi:MAG TPA: SusC/RagA family TonB-linked outer membrane protein [Puia sp.]|nr:SusC/RagA family TonB-linked outer membrane protein [Puia sp.]